MSQGRNLDPEVGGRIAGVVEQAVESAAQQAVTTIFEAVAAYPDSPDGRLREDLKAHCRNIFGVLARCLREGRPAEPEDFPFTSEFAVRRIEQGVALTDFMRAYRLAQACLWQELRSRLVADPTLAPFALDVVDDVMQVIEAGSQAAAAAYLEAGQHRMADHDRVRLDLLDDLLAGRTPVTAARTALVRALGLAEPVGYRVASIVLRPDAPPGQVPPGPVPPGQVTADSEDDGDRLRAVASAVRRAVGRAARGLIAVRQGEVVATFPVQAGLILDAALDEAATALSTAGLDLRAGVSIEHSGFADGPLAHREAVIARRACTRVNRVVALDALTPGGYLALRDDPTARRLIREDLRRFVQEDVDDAGDEVVTLLEYVGADLNAKLAADRLGIHVNTMYHRISRRTGCDLRCYTDLDEIVTAVRLLVPGTAHTVLGRR